MQEVAVLIVSATFLGIIFVALFAGAFYLGAKAQEKLGILFEINLDKARSKYKALSSLPEALNDGSWSGNVDLKGPAKTGSEHPAGVRPPSPQELSEHKKKSHDWRDALKTASHKKIT